MFDKIYYLTGNTPTELVEIGLKEQDHYAEENGRKTYKYLPFRTITNISAILSIFPFNFFVRINCVDSLKNFF